MLGIGINIFKSKTLSTDVSSGIITGLTITTPGSFAILATNNYVITQGVNFITSGSGVGATITVTAGNDGITAIVSIDNGGTGFMVNDTLTVTTINGQAASVNPVLTVNSIS